MNQWRNDFLNLENELLNTRKKLNDLIYERNNMQNPQDKALYEDKLHYLEVELQYINNQLQLLKNRQNISVTTNVPVQNVSVQANVQTQNINAHANVQKPETVQQTTNPNKDYSMHFEEEHKAPQNSASPYPTVSYGIMGTITKPAKRPRTTQDYEKLFGKNLMGIFASILIFISLVIFATLILPHLTDTLKMLAMYIASTAVLSAGLLLHKKNKNNLFYIAIIGCGAGSLYLSLLLSNIYFAVIGDLALYGLILLWAVFVKYLTKIKHYVFTIIGQAGIFIASVLGTMMCVFESDPQKYFVLSIFYFISAFVFSNVSTTYLMPLLRSGENDEQPALSLSLYESNLCTHICKTLNVGVFASGFLSLEHAIHRHSASSGPSALIIFNVVLFIIYLLAEYFFSYKEKCKDGLAFQILTMANTILAIVLINDLDLFTINQVCVFIYLAGIATLLYVEKKDAGYTIFSQICCPFLILFGCVLNPWMREHLYIYLTAVPFMLYGQWKKKGFYLGVGIAYWVLLPLAIWAEHYNCVEYLIVMAVVYGVFLYTCRKTEQTWYKITGYLVLCYTTLTLVYDISYTFMGSRSTPTNARLLTFLFLAVIHLVLNKLKYFGREHAVEVMMIAINAFLMVGGCLSMYDTDAIFLKLLVILVTILLFMINSKELLSKHKYAGYYVALKYTALMLCIINSYDAVDYVTSICLLVFAVISIVTGFYKDMIAFRLYGLILSMLSVVKLIMFDIKYDSTIESAVSFFISGVLCFVISFIYNRIDGKLRGK